jgi:hypothetical protein
MPALHPQATRIETIITEIRSSAHGRYRSADENGRVILKIPGQLPDSLPAARREDEAAAVGARVGNKPSQLPLP